MIRLFLFLLSVVIPLPSFAASLPVTYAVKNSVGETIMYAPTTTYTKTIDSTIGAQTFTSQATEISTAAVVADKLQQIGYRPDDPRVGITIQAIEQQATNVASGATFGAVMGAAGTAVLAALAGTPVTWGVIGAAALAGAVSGVAAELVAGGYKYLFGPDGLLSSSAGQAPVSGGVNINYDYIWCAKSSTPYDYCSSDPTSAYSSLNPSAQCTVIIGGNLDCTITVLCNNSWAQLNYPECIDPSAVHLITGYRAQVGQVLTSSYLSDGGKSCAAPLFYVGGQCVSPAGSSAPPAPVTASKAVDSMPASDKVKPVSDKLMAQSVNNLWQSAAASNPAILPPQSVSDSDVAVVRSQNPSIWPMGQNLSDLPSGFSTAPAPSSSSSPTIPSYPGASVSPGPQGVVSLPSGAFSSGIGSPGTGIGTGSTTSTTTSTSTNPDGSTSTTVNNTVVQKLDLGADPATPAPTLESTPTAQQILLPITSLMPDLKSYTMPSHTSSCPKPSMFLWGKTLTLSSHCDLLDQVAPALHSVMNFVWVAVGLFIILAA